MAVAKFAFKLEGVLEQRRHAERQCQRALAAAQREQMQLRAALEEARALTEKERLDLRGPVQAAVLMSHARYADAMRGKIAVIEEQIVQVSQAVDAAQAALSEAGKQRKVLEKLKEKQQNTWAEEERRRETRMADEISARVARDKENAPG